MNAYQPSARAEAVFRRTYSRPKDDGTFESYENVMDRVGAHQKWLWERQLGRPLDAEQLAELDELKRLGMRREVLPAGRTLWLGGTQIARERECSQFNCAALVVRTVYDIVDVMWLLLNGCGVGCKPEPGTLNGFSRKIETLEVIRSERTAKGGVEHNVETVEGDTWTIKIGDSGEAWAKAIGKLIAGKNNCSKLVFDLSEIRPEGSRLSRYGWISSGDTVIADELPKIASILNERVDTLLTKIDICDIVNHLGVIQTGRRGAEILFVDYGTEQWEEFASMKDGAWSDPRKAHRSQSNNSLIFDRKPTRGELENIFGRMVVSGGSEPGFVNKTAAKARAPWFSVGNPCMEILLADKGFCNLIEVDVSKFEGRSLDAARAMYIAARANYRQTLVNLDDGILQRAWHENNQFLRLCGVGITGIDNSPWLDDTGLISLRANAVVGAAKMAEELGTPRSKNVTTIKPSGTLSKVMDTTEGIHKPLGRYIFNNVVFQRTEPMLATLEDAGYRVFCHPTNEVSKLVSFPVEYPNSKMDDYEGTPVNLTPAWDQLETYRGLMNLYVDHNASTTIYYDVGEIPYIIDWFMQHWDSYVGVSFAYRTDPTKTAADFGAAYLPQEVVDEETFRAYTAELRPVNWDSLNSGAVENDDLEDDCEGGACPVR